jgi:hypothetical protein
MSDLQETGSQETEAVRRIGNRLDAEWTTLNAIREMLGIALKGRTSPT